MLEDLAKSYFKNTFPISENSFLELKRIFKYAHKAKDEVFIKLGKPNQSEYLLLKGYCRSYLTNPEGEDITLSFFKEESVLPPNLIRTKNQISLLNFHSLTDIAFIEFDALLFLNLMIENLEIRNFGNTILLNELIRKTEKEISLVSLTAKERLLQFRNEYSILENLIAHPMIASYLGITNVSLSRLRSDLMKA